MSRKDIINQLSTPSEDYKPEPEIIDVPPLDESKPLPDVEINDRSFYSSILEGDPDNFSNNFATTKGDLSVMGESPMYDKHIKSWEAEQTINLENDVNNILVDPNVSNEHKISVLNSYNKGELISHDLRDKYIQTVASDDTIHITKEDEKSQDLMLDSISKVVDAHREVEQMKQDALLIKDGGLGDLLLGIAAEMIPGVYVGQTAYVRHKLGEALGEAQSDYMAKSLTAVGHTNAEIGQILSSTLTPERQKELVKSLIDSAAEFAPFEYNRWAQLNDKLFSGELPEHEKWIEDAIGWIDAFGFSKMVLNPVKFVKGLLTFQKISAGEKEAFNKALLSLGFKPLDKLGKKVDKAEFLKAEKARQDATKMQEDIASNPQTGSAIATPISGKEDIPVIPSSIAIKGVQPSVSEMSPLGVTKAASPTKARDLANQALLDEKVAEAVGSSKGEIVGTFGLEKIDDDFIKNNPDIAKDIDAWDKKFNEHYDKTKLDQYLVDTVERTKDKEKIYRTFQETQGVYYQASNSTMVESLGQVAGRARFGRNSDFGFNTIEEATLAKDKLDAQFVNSPTDKFQTTINKNESGQYYVDMNWTKEYDTFSSRVFGIDSTNMTFMGFNVNNISKSFIAKHFIPPTVRLPEWVTKGAFNVSISALKTQEIFSKLLKDITKTTHKAELEQVLMSISENQKYLKEDDIVGMFPYLSQESRKELMQKQYLWQRLSDYTHAITNRIESARLSSEGMQGIWSRTGEHLGNGKAVDTIPVSKTEIWDFSTNAPIRKPDDLKGRQLVKLDSPKSSGGNKYNYGLLGAGDELDALPHNVVPKIEGYVPRFNVEHWYVKSHPTKIRVDGESISDINTLRKDHTNTIGAAATEAEAKQLVKKMQGELGDDVVVFFARERSDIGDTIVTDFKVYKEHTSYGKTRGDRLPTLNGFARIEHPLVAADKRIKSLSRIDAWRGYEEVFQKNFMDRFSAFLPEGTFPNIIHDLKLPVNATEDMAKSFQVAQRLFEQYTNSKYKLNISDVVWKSIGHKIADAIEGYLPTDAVREIANKGDLFRKSIKSLGTNLFLNLNPAAQWLVQTQVILPFAATESGFRKSMHMLPALMINILSRASEAKPYAGVMKKLSEKIAITNPKEFNAIADAIFDAGLPQSVDLNMMLHGGLDELSKPLTQGFGGKVFDKGAQVLKTPGQIGKTIGYAPAQLMADMAGFLYAKARWEKLNPGKNWNTPQNIRQIAADGWDIMGSMSTRAGALTMQDGYLGLLFQFQAILAKNMFTLFSSKTLKKAEGEIVSPHVKLAGANAALFGVYGVPASTLMYNIWDEWFGDETDPEKLAQYQKYRGGLVDLVTNATMDALLGEESLDLAISKRIGPMPDTLPYVDLGWNLFQYMSGNKTDNPRFPFINAGGSIYEAVIDANNILSARRDYNTIESLLVYGAELTEATSGGNNFAKAMAINEFGKKKDKFGNNLGLELAHKQMIGQLFGITTQAEVMQYEALNNKKERDQYIKDRSTEILKGMEKLKDKIGTPEWAEYVRRIKILNDGTDESVQEEVALAVIAADKHKWNSNRESMMKYLMDNYKGQNDSNLNTMLATFKNGTPKEKAFVEFLERNFGKVERE